MDEYVSTKEAAEILEYTQGYIAKLCRDGKFDLVAWQAGGRNEWRIPRIAVENYRKKKSYKRK